jgi:HD-GYP domain-containing protein (c-di-GMP phosphodiesterase class II)
MYAHKHSSRLSPLRQTGDVLLRALHERDPELRSHMQNVAELAEATAARFGLPPDEVVDIRHAAELHDVGKMAIPDAILSKPGPLDQAELEFIRKHTLIGERIIGAAPALVPVARLVRSSHERWDGGGYPDGLVGEAIPLGSRIIAACDAYDSMISERPYSVSMVPARALEELERGAGTQFDPRVATLLCKIVECQSGDDESRSLRVTPSGRGSGAV